MENSSASSTPTDVSNRRVLDASGTRWGRLSPPDPVDDPRGVPCSILQSCSRTGSFHAIAVDVGPLEPRVEVEEASFDHEEEVYDGSQPVLDPRLIFGLKIVNVAYNPSLYRRGNEGQTASQELYNSDEYASQAQVVDELTGKGFQVCPAIKFVNDKREVRIRDFPKSRHNKDVYWTDDGV